MLHANGCTDYLSGYGCNDTERREWVLFGLFIGDLLLTHVEWVMARFRTVDEWLGPEGDRCRSTWHMPIVPDECRKQWMDFKTEHVNDSLVDVEDLLEIAQDEHERALGGD